jgi:hypothetical protein
MLQPEYPCLDDSLTETEQFGRAMAGRLLAGLGAVDHDDIPSERHLESAARVADRVAGEQRYEPFASASAYLRTANGIGVAACARRWASFNCPVNCPLYRKER